MRKTQGIADMTDVDPSRVHALETSEHEASYPSYRRYRESENPDELQASLRLYEKVAERDGGNRVTQFNSCRQIAWFVRDNETGRVHVQSNSCRLRWCPFCAKAKQAYMMHAISEWSEPKHNIRFVTLTLKHTSEPLSGQIDRLYSAFKLMRRDKDFKKLIASGIWFFQVKLNKDLTEWHPHLHILVTGQYIPKRLLSGIWYRCTKSSKIVDIAYVHNKQAVIRYVARYCARPSNLSEMPDEFTIDVFDALHHRRLCGSWGCGKELKLSIPKDIPRGRFTSLGYWSTVHELSRSDDAAKSILLCWAHGLVLEPGISCQSIDNELMGVPNLDTEWPDQKVVDPQFNFR